MSFSKIKIIDRYEKIITKFPFQTKMFSKFTVGYSFITAIIINNNYYNKQQP